MAHNTNSKLFAHVDCNNFYVSCERIFQPSLRNKPVAVLSNNDGCIIARSNEVKALGIPMGAPAFKMKPLIEKRNITLLSANFPLYLDISKRIYHTLSNFTSEIEYYSVDESFLELTHLHCHDLDRLGREIKTRIYQDIGIPVSVGIGLTKTLAKTATKIAKKYQECRGVLDLTNVCDEDSFLERIGVEDLWGVGRKYARLLNGKGYCTAKDMKYAYKPDIKQQMTVQGERLVLELNGICCIPLKAYKPKKMVARSRSFGRYVESYSEMSKAISTFAVNVGKNLRQEKIIAKYMQVFIMTNGFNKKQAQYFNYVTLRFVEPTSYSPYLINYALQGLQLIFKDGYKYKKGGVVCSGLIPEDECQSSMFWEETPTKQDQHAKLMAVVDCINRTIGPDTVKFAAQGTDRKWWMNQTRLSKHFTTDWRDLCCVS